MFGRDDNNAPAVALPGLFVSPDWLQQQIENGAGDSLRIVQVGGEKFYSYMHIPGALQLPYSDIAVKVGNIPGQRREPEDLARRLGRIGIGADTPVVAYDASGGQDAGRLLWTLRCMGHTNNAILDGGMAAWAEAKRPMENGFPETDAVVFVPAPSDAYERNLAEVEAISQDDFGAILLDVRTVNEYVGNNLNGPKGHIRRGVHLEWTEVLASPRNPVLKPEAEIRALFANVGVEDPSQEVVIYCQTAHRASQTWVLLKHLGFENVRLYDGSMAEWGYIEMKPVVPGNEPT